MDSTRTARAVNVLARLPGASALGMRVAGLEPREAPLFAAQTLRQWWTTHEPIETGSRGEVMLWPDTFTNYFQPGIGRAAVQVLESAGWRMRLPSERLCCGMTWISTGQLDKAKNELRHSVAALADLVRAGGYVVGLEPSCTAVFRSDVSDLLGDDPDVALLSDQAVTLAELLMDHTPGWTPSAPRHRRQALAQVHCHQHAVLGWDADARLLDAVGIDVAPLDSGCFGLAGNFGFAGGHGEVSEACAERVMLPRIRDADRSTVVLADSSGTDRYDDAPTPEQTLADRPAPPSTAMRFAVGAVGLVAATTAAGFARHLARHLARRSR